MNELLKVTDLTTGYGDLRVVWDLSFSVREGEVLALLGRNGAGKTTTLRAISGLNKAMRGTIEFDGVDVTGRPAYERIQQGIGYVQENKRLIGDITVEENLRLGAYGRKPSRSELSDRLDWAYEAFPILRDRRTSMASLLSGGQQQMLAIAQALMPEPRILLIDEPSAGLAPAIVGEVLESLTRLRESGMSIVLVEQSVDFALSIASEVVAIDLGRLVFTADAKAPHVRDAVQDVYLGRSAVATGSDA